MSQPQYANAMEAPMIFPGFGFVPRAANEQEKNPARIDGLPSVVK